MTAGCCRGFRAAGVAVRRSRVAVRRLRVVPGRTASFKAEEEEYALVMIKFFNEGLIELPDGTPQRAFIASMLACDRARITKKKLNGLCVGKKYLACARTLETAARRAATAAGLAAARDRFLRKRMLEDAPAKKVAIFCVTEKLVDAEDCSLVTKGPNPQQPNLGDLIRSSAVHPASQGSTNRYRPPSITEWQEITADVPDESHKGVMARRCVR